MQRMEKLRNGMVRLLAALTILAAPIVSIVPATVAEATSIPRLDTIRVALALHTDKFNTAIPTVTLSADQGMAIGNLAATGATGRIGTAGTQAWLNTEPGEKIAVGLDQYMVEWLTTADFKQARQLSQSLGEQRQPVGIYRVTLQGRQAYQVVSGPFADAGEAAAAANAGATAAAGTAAAAATSAPRVSGPLHLSAGSYATAAEAASGQAALLSAGIPAEIALAPAAGVGVGAPAYAVWVGREPDAAHLAALRQTIAAKLPSLALQPVDAQAPYLLQRDDVTKSTDGAAVTPHFYINEANQKLTVAPLKPDSFVKVEEKSNRQYRGTLELSQHNGDMAVINELDFESYLYSVVSAEMGKGWPPEALKAQAVTARTYALKSGNKYGIAQVSDSTIDQVYYGVGAEQTDCIQAVIATIGGVLTDSSGKLIDALYSSNAGGMTADPSEVYGGQAAYLRPVASPDDAPAQGKSAWKQAMLSNGTKGYISSDYIRPTGETNEGGLPWYALTGTNVNFRPGPGADNAVYPPIAKLNTGDKVLVLGDSATSADNAYSWTRGPYDGDQLLRMINKALSQPLSGPITTLAVTRRGPSGRAIEVAANGIPLKVAYPDAIRGLLGGLPSTRFEIEQAGMYTILGAEGRTRTFAGDSSALRLLSDQAAAPAAPPSSQSLFLLNGIGQASVVKPAASQQFVFRGTGTGHGLGMSQWGAKKLAEQGYDYARILNYYYTGVTLSKAE
jgi:stage II sporulation protein D